MFLFPSEMVEGNKIKALSVWHYANAVILNCIKCLLQ